MSPGIKIITDKERGEIAVLEVDSHISRWCEDHSSIVIERIVPDHLLPLIPVGGTVIDVGANIGTHTVAYAEKVGEEGKAWAFEPHPLAYECLTFNTARFVQVRLSQCPVGAEVGFAKLSLPSDTNIGATCIYPCEDGDLAIYTIDMLPLQRCDFIKIDAEGSEMAVLQGAVETITKLRPILYVELNDGTLRRFGLTKNDVAKFIMDLGYTRKFLDPTHDFSLPQVDVLFLPK